MGALDFLFEGKPPASVTTYGKSVKDVPKWMSDYTQGLIAKANAVSAEPYQAYEGPRIAGFDPSQERAFGMVEGNVGKFDPMMAEAAAGTRTAAGANPLATAQPYMDKAAGSFPGAVDQYMDPYIQNVLNRQESMATRTLEEKFLPALQKSFIGAGQFGSRGPGSSMETMGLRGVRDISEGLEEQRLGALSGAYGQAADIYGRDVGRQADLARTAGTLEMQGAELGLRGAQQLGALGESSQAMAARDAAGLEAVGAQQRDLPQASMDLAYQDFLKQQQHPKEQVGFLSDVIRGLPSAAVGSSTTSSQTGPGDNFGPSPLAQMVGAYGTYKGITSAKGGLARKRNVIDIPRSDWKVIKREVA